MNPWAGYPVPAMRHEALYGDRVVRCFWPRPAGVLAMFERVCREHPQLDAMVCEGRRWSYGATAAWAERIAAGLAARGLQAGDRVVMLMGNRPEFVVVLLALLRLGAMAVPVGVREQRPGLTFIAQQCGARGIVFDAALADRVPLAETDTAVILYTSGTPGRPKGAMLTQLNIVHSVLHYEACMKLQHADRSALAVPASHVTGLIAVIAAMWQVAGCVVIVPENADSVGVPLPAADIRVMDDDGRERPPGEIGELWIAGPMVVPGYWANPEATAASFTAGWWHSGDLGSIDAQGFVRVFDRQKDMLNRGGYKVYSVEVENTLMAWPGVVEAALRAFCAQQLADYKVPESIAFSAAPLPRNANGELMKGLLRESAVHTEGAPPCRSIGGGFNTGMACSPHGDLEGHRAYGVHHHHAEPARADP